MASTVNSAAVVEMSAPNPKVARSSPRAPSWAICSHSHPMPLPKRDPKVNDELRTTFGSLMKSCSAPINSASAGPGDPYLPTPCIHISGLPEPLALPPTEQQLSAVLEIPHVLPLLHTHSPVPHSHVVPAEHVTFHNLNWQKGLTDLTNRIATELSITSPVVAKLNGLFIRSAGACVRPFVQNRSLSSPHAIGALVITLPSSHEGGAMRIHCGQEEFVIESGANDGSSRIQYVAYFFGCERELHAVTSGHRISLEYELHLTDSTAPRPSLQPLPVAESCVIGLQKFAQDWCQKSLEVCTLEKLCFFLTGNYTDKQLAWDSLEGKDACILSALRKASCFHLMLAEFYRPSELDPVPSDLWSSRFVTSSDEDMPSFRNVVVTFEESVQELLSVPAACTGGKERILTGPRSGKLGRIRYSERTALVLWPKRMLVSAVEKYILRNQLVKKFQKGRQLLGCKDSDEFVTRLLRRSTVGARLRFRVLNLLLDERVTILPARLALEQLNFVEGPLARESEFLSRLVALVKRHGLCKLKDSIVGMLTTDKNSETERAVCTGWRLVEELERCPCVQSSEEKRCLKDIVKALVPHLKCRLLRSDSKHETSGTACEGTIIAVFTCLRNLGLQDTLTTALSIVVQNKWRFDKRTSVCNVLPKLLRLNDGVPSWGLKCLARSVVRAIKKDFQEPMNDRELSRILFMLLPYGLCVEAVAEAVNRRDIFPGLRCVFVAIVNLWRNAKAACKPHIAFYAGVMSRCVRDAASEETEILKEVIIADGLLTLAQFDELRCDDVESGTSYQLQFAQAIVARRELFSVRTIGRVVLAALDNNISVARDAAKILLSRSIEDFEADSSVVVPECKDWTVKIPPSLSCRCKTCLVVISFLENPLSNKMNIVVQHEAERKHIVSALSTACAASRSEFPVEVVREGDDLQGRILLMKKRDGQTDNSKLRMLLAQTKEQDEKVTLLNRLREKNAKYESVEPVAGVHNARRRKRMRVITIT